MKTLVKNETHSIEETLLILDTAIGLIALPYKVAEEALNRGRSVFDTAQLAEPLERNDELLDAHSIAKRFGMNATWFLARARENRIPCVRIGKYVRFELDKVRDFFRRDDV